MGLTKGQLTAIAGLLESIEDDEAREGLVLTGTATVQDTDGRALANVLLRGDQNHELIDVIA